MVEQEKILNCLQEVGIELSAEQYPDDLRLHGMDSLAMVLLLNIFEKKMGVKINLANFKEEDFYTLDTIAALLQRHLT